MASNANENPNVQQMPALVDHAALLQQQQDLNAQHDIQLQEQQVIFQQQATEVLNQQQNDDLQARQKQQRDALLLEHQSQRDQLVLQHKLQQDTLVAQQQPQINALYAKIKNDMEDFAVHANYIDSVPLNMILTGEADERLKDMFRLNDDVKVGARSLKSFQLTDNQRQRLEQRMNDFSVTSWSTIGKFRDLLTLRNASMTQAEAKPLLNASHDGTMSGVRVKLPDFKLPDFDGSLDKWLTWRDTYDALIHRNSTLSKVVKFHYLRAAMKFPAGQQNVLNNFPFNENSYDEAWKAVCERYDDKRKLKSQLFNSLLTVKKMTADSSTEVRRMLDSFSSIVTSMDLLQCTYDDILVHIVQYRLDDQTSKEWQKYIGKEEPKFSEMKDFLTEYWHTLDSVPSQSKRQFPSKGNDSKPSSTSKSFSASAAPQSSSCQLCKESHYLHQCSKFRLLSVPERYKVVNDNRLCRNCFSPAHIQRNCTSLHRCRLCKANHHTMLHSERSSNQVEVHEAHPVRPSQHQGNFNPNVKPFQPTPPPRLSYPPRSNVSSTDLHSTEMRTFSSNNEALLSTVSILVLDAKGSWQSCRALMDSGSQSNYITTGFAQKLGIELIRTCQPVIGINGQSSVIKHRTTAIFSSRYREFSGEIGCCVSDDITGFLPPRRIDVSKLKIPAVLFLADPNFHEPGKIDMLLGTGIYHDSLLGNVINQRNMPVLMETEFGWTVGGNFPTPSSSSSYISCFTQMPNSGFAELDAKIDKFIDIENYGTTSKKILSREEQYCIDHYNELTTQDDTGRWFTHLPFNYQIDELGNNWAHAMRQFHYQEKKRQEDAEYNSHYCDYMLEFETSGHMTETSELEKSDGYFMPHHGVLRISSTTTKLRPVFNASSKSETGLSLNDCLCVGPTVQPDSFDILLRFREKRFVLKSDVEKMYRQVFIDPSERKYQKILWRSSPSEPIKHYTLNTVTFGVSSAPFLATNTLNRIAEEFSKRFPAASEIIKSSFYVDDLLFSFDSIDEGLKLRDQLRYLLASSRFPTRKWSSNHPDLLKNLPKNDVELTEEISQIIKTLGIVWKPGTDVISFLMKLLGESPMTKAEILSEIASIYDPIGIIGPVLLLAKLHMKPLRLMKWNQKLSEEDVLRWNEFRSQLAALNNVSVARHAIAINPVSIQLHGFCDASEAAYGAVIYIRSCDSIGNTQISLICSKSRVSPPKQQSIARLELCAAVLLSKLVERILKILTVNIKEVMLWSDSMIALYWIATESSKLSTFVGNRVSVIQELTAYFIWRHILGHMNPADLISRGLMPQMIIDCILWWNGPEFLAKSPSEWPESLLTINEDNPEMTKELRKTFVAAQPSKMFTLIETRFSSIQKLTNCVAYIRRFAVKQIRQNGPLSIDELENSMFSIVRIIQQTLFPLEHRFFMRQRENPEIKENFPTKSSILSLSPFMDENCIIRVGGRVQQSPRLTMEQKHQIIIPKCHYAKLIVRNMHQKFMHPGQSAMLSYVREYFWILDCKAIIRKVQHECLLCFRVKPKFPTQIMGSLPAARVTMTPPFLSTAVDYAGPFNMRTSLTKKSSLTKVYIAMFKCMSTGAIHLEAVTALSTAAFIATFDRFISRRGLCRDIFSDNGTEFVGANNEFKRILSEIEKEIGEYLKEKSIHWHFTTPVAPHAGGYYESGIKTMKHHLVRECADRSFDYEQFSTLLCKIEAIINSRPLTPISDDPTDLEVLTPAHFLVGRSLIAKPERNFIPVNTGRLDRFNQLQQLQQKLWDRWYHEYLHHLQTRPNNFRKENEFHEGDMVLVKDSNLPPLKWLMGRIIKVLPDKNGIVRNVIIKTPTGEKHRHIRYLAFLPLEKSQTSSAGGECSATEKI